MVYMDVCESMLRGVDVGTCNAISNTVMYIFIYTAFSIGLAFIQLFALVPYEQQETMLSPNFCLLLPPSAHIRNVFSGPLAVCRLCFR